MISAALGCATVPVQDRPWLEARSEHFAIYSSLAPDETEALAVDLEVFRAAVDFFTNVEKLDSPIPIEIFVFGHERDLRRFARDRTVAGFIRTSPRSYQVLLSPHQRMSGRVILYHEYVHFVLRNAALTRPPRWYDEGFADFLATAERIDDELIVGEPHPVRAESLIRERPMRVEKLLQPRRFAEFSDREVARFYATAWLLVHFLSLDFEDPDGLQFSDRFATYLAAIGNSTTPEEALELAWGLKPEELDRILDRVIRTGVRFGSLPLSRLRYSERVTLHPVSAGEMARRLGSIALSGGDLGFARKLYQAALAGDPDDARAIAGLADTFKFENRMEEAEPLFERAVELDPTDVLNLLDRAEYWLDRAVRAEDQESRTNLAEKAREESRSANGLAPHNPEALWVYGMSNSLVAGHDPNESIRALEQAAEILPSEDMILYSLLQAYVASGRRAEAETVAQRLLIMARSKEQLAQIERMLEDACQPQ